MANLLVGTSRFPSSLYPGVELARRLAAAGHRVTLAAPPHAGELASRHGLEPLALEPSRFEEFARADARRSITGRLLDVRRRREEARDALALEGFARAVRERKPDLALIDGEMHEHVVATRAAGIPVALLNIFASIWRAPGLPPPHRLVRPGVGWRGSPPGLALLWWALRLRKWQSALAQRVRRVGCDRISLLRDQAREAGLDLRDETDATHWLKPFTWRRLPALSLHALEFEFPHRPPEHVRFVGPMVLESRPDRPLPGQDRARLDALFAPRPGGGRPPSLLYAGFGSTASTRPELLRRLAAAVAGRPGWELVLSLGDRIDPAALGPIPERVHVFPWVPQLEILRHADAAVTHGGIHTLDECVLARVPVLVYCGFETDMAGNTARVEHHGIGLAGDHRDGPPEIRARLERLLGEPGFRSAVGRLSESYRAYAANGVAERAVGSLLDGLSNGGAGGTSR